jgi:hypothetical protein
VPSLSTITTKKDMLKLAKDTCVAKGVTTLTLPAKEGKRASDVPILISEIDPAVRAAQNRPTVPTCDELKEAWLVAMKGHDELKKLLECQLEAYLVNEVGGEFLWTPPYTPTLQPIEEFWGGGK